MKRTRVTVLLCILVLLYLGILARLYSLQAVPAAHQRYNRLSLHPRTVPMAPVRGRILARDGTVLAGNELVYHLRFRYEGAYGEQDETLDPRRIPLSILVQELQRHGPFPDKRTAEQRLLELASDAIDVVQEARLPPQLDDPDDPDEPASGPFVLLVDRVPPAAAKALKARLRTYWRTVQIRPARPAGSGGALSRLWRLLPGVADGEHRVYVNARWALRMEITLYRLALAISGPTAAEETFQALCGRIDETLDTIEGRVDRQMESPRYAQLEEKPRARERRAARRAHYRQYWPLCEDVPERVATEIEYHPDWYRGLRVEGDIRRLYPQGEAFGTLTGWLTRVDTLVDRRQEVGSPLLEAFKAEERTAPEFIRSREGKMEGRDLVGASGLERHHDEALRGLYGRRVLMRDKLKGPRILLEEVPLVHGRDIRISIDPALQELLYRALAERIRPFEGPVRPGLLGVVSSTPAPPAEAGVAGSAVVMDIETGELLASVGYPGIDPSRLMGDSGYIQSLEDALAVTDFLYDRPTTIALFPGSVFKIFVAVAAMESATAWKGEFSEERRYQCRNPFPLIQTTTLRCSHDYGHPTPDSAVNLAEALCYSCNNYFYYVGLQHLDASRIQKYANAFGFGRDTGIDLTLPSMARGSLDDAEEAKTDTSVCHYSIGQVHVEATPLQVVRAVAAVARRGKGLPCPRLLLDDHSGSSGAPQPAQPLSLRNPRTMEVIHRGLWDVGHAPGGTAEDSEEKLGEYSAAYKTGTAEKWVERGREVGEPIAGEKRTKTVHHGWLVGFAPFDKPQIAFAVVIERTSIDVHGSDVSGPVVRKLLEYFEETHPGQYLLQDGGVSGMPGGPPIAGGQ